ncbi:MAG: sulfurtransferase TusA family protein [Alphaproteobacteria bacterium]|nr:sulfurtransferase TusA family protein [Alphaproteobacteria bacterium]
MQELDASLDSCPQPLLKTRRLLDGLQAGDTVKVVATDPGSVMDFEAFCRRSGNEMLASTIYDGQYTFVIRKS